MLESREEDGGRFSRKKWMKLGASCNRKRWWKSQKNTVTGERKKNEYFGTVAESVYTRASMVEKSLFIFHRIKPMVDQRRRKKRRKIKG